MSGSNQCDPVPVNQTLLVSGSDTVHTHRRQMSSRRMSSCSNDCED